LKKIFLMILMFSSFAFAGFGGSRSGGGFRGGSFSGSRSFSSSRSSYFGGSRASASRVTISRPSYSGGYTRGFSGGSSHTTIVREVPYHSSSGPGFFSGLMMGHMFSRPAPVVIAGQGGVIQSAPVVQTSESGHSVLFFLVWMLILSGVIYLGYKYLRQV
jgi:hypothetical protein